MDPYAYARQLVMEVKNATNTKSKSMSGKQLQNGEPRRHRTLFA